MADVGISDGEYELELDLSVLQRHKAQQSSDSSEPKRFGIKCMAPV